MRRYPTPFTLLPGLLATAVLLGCPSEPKQSSQESAMHTPDPVPSAQSSQPPFPVAQREAAEQGVPEAQYRLGRHLEESGDKAGAAKWVEKAAHQGHAPAQARLSFYFQIGRGVPQDHAAAFKWAQQAAEAGDAQGAYLMGLSHWQGYGVEKNGALALEWYLKAAAQHHAVAELQLGTFYADGTLVAADRDQARAWFQRSFDHGEKDALEICRIRLDRGIFERIFAWMNAT